MQPYPICLFLLAEVLTHGSSAKHNWAGSLALLLSAAIIWVLGNKLNGAPEKDLIDPQTGQTIRLRRRKHALFFIPMQYIAVFAVIVALVVLVAPVAQR